MGDPLIKGELQYSCLMPNPTIATKELSHVSGNYAKVLEITYTSRKHGKKEP
jgi:hypothetical protein